MFAALACLLAACAAAQDRYFDANGVRIRYVDAGAGPVVVLVHGLTGDIERAWIHTGILTDLARDYRVLAFDLRGHGHSDKPHEPRAYEEIGLDVIRLMDHAGVKRAHAALMRARRALLVSDAEIAALRVPTLAVVGTADPARPRVEAMRKVWPGLRVEVVPGAAHPTVHERGLPRHPEFTRAIRRHIAP